MQMPGNYPKARRVEAHRMKIEQAERDRDRDTDEPKAGFTCLAMQDDWGGLGVCVYVDVGRRNGRRDKKVMRGAEMDGTAHTLREGTESVLMSAWYVPPFNK